LGAGDRLKVQKSSGRRLLRKWSGTRVCMRDRWASLSCFALMLGLNWRIRLKLTPLVSWLVEIENFWKTYVLMNRREAMRSLRSRIEEEKWYWKVHWVMFRDWRDLA
jgi:hypothetical protein